MRLAVAGASAVVLGCFNAPSADVQFSCDPQRAPECPPDYSCQSDGCCHRDGSDVEASFGACKLDGTGGSGSGTDTDTDASSSSGAPTTSSSGGDPSDTDTSSSSSGSTSGETTDTDSSSSSSSSGGDTDASTGA